jgi:hypothetical protein
MFLSVAEVGNFSAEAVREISELVEKSRPLFVERNRYVHGLRVIGDEENLIYTSDRKTGSINQYSAQVNALRQLGQQFSQIAATLISWTGRYVEGKSGVPPKRPMA